MLRSTLPCLAVFVLSVGCSKPVTTVATPPAPLPIPQTGIKTEFVEYTRWAKFKPGTAMVKRTVTEEKGNPAKTIEVTTTKLLELTAEHAVVETHLTGTRFDGVKMDTLPIKQTIHRYFYLQDNVKIDQNKGTTDSITVAGKTYQAVVLRGKDRNEAGEVVSTVWSTEDVPGGLLKSETFISATNKLMTVDLIELTPAG